MKSTLIAFVFLFATTVFAKTETRCGWISNPTPANYWITDSIGTWILATQGGDSAVGLDDKLTYPNEDQYVKTNGTYGYWCGCVKGETNAEDMTFKTVVSTQVKTLKVCLEDINLLPAL